jgi:hypothetical protein
MADRPTKKPRSRASSPSSDTPKFVKRPKSERKSLSPELEAFAASDEERFRPPRKPRSPRLVDTRPDAPVRGVGNRDARAVFELHRDALASLVEEREDEAARDALAQGLALVVATDLFKANHLASFDAFAVDVLGMPLEDARELASEGASELGLPGQALSEETIAAFFRAEAALLEAEFEGVVGLAVDEDGAERLILDLEGPRASRALFAIGQKVAPLAIDQEKIEQRRAEREAERFERELEAAPRDEDESASQLDALDEGFRPPRRSRPPRDDERRGGFRDERRGGSRDDRGGFGGDKRGGFGGDRGGFRDERRGGFGGERRGGFRDDRGGFGGDKRGGFGGDKRGFGGDKRGGFGGDKRGGFGGDKRGGFGGDKRGGFRDDRGGFGGDKRGLRDDRGGFRDERRGGEFGDRPSRRFGAGAPPPRKKKGRFSPDR